MLTALGRVDAAALRALRQRLRGMAGTRAVEIANQVAVQAPGGELRARARSVLQQLRTIGPGGYHPPGGAPSRVPLGASGSARTARWSATSERSSGAQRSSRPRRAATRSSARATSVSPGRSRNAVS